MINPTPCEGRRGQRGHRQGFWAGSQRINMKMASRQQGRRRELHTAEAAHAKRPQQSGHLWFWVRRAVAHGCVGKETGD